MNRDEWIQHGLQNGYLQMICFMHDGFPPVTDEEEKEFIDNDDPCLHRYVVI